jgi:hypothetical protein
MKASEFLNLVAGLFKFTAERAKVLPNYWIYPNRLLRDVQFFWNP